MQVARTLKNLPLVKLAPAAPADHENISAKTSTSISPSLCAQKISRIQVSTHSQRQCALLQPLSPWSSLGPISRLCRYHLNRPIREQSWHVLVATADSRPMAIILLSICSRDKQGTSTEFQNAEMEGQKQAKRPVKGMIARLWMSESTLDGARKGKKRRANTEKAIHFTVEAQSKTKLCFSTVYYLRYVFGEEAIPYGENGRFWDTDNCKTQQWGEVDFHIKECRICRRIFICDVQGWAADVRCSWNWDVRVVLLSMNLSRESTQILPSSPRTTRILASICILLAVHHRRKWSTT